MSKKTKTEAEELQEQELLLQQEALETEAPETPIETEQPEEQPEEPETPEQPEEEAPAAPEQPESNTRKEGETRGRHKKNCTCEKCTAKKAEKKKPETPAGEPAQPNREEFKEKSFDNILSEEEKRKAGEPQPAATPTAATVEPAKPKFDVSKYISGALLLMLCDLLFPNALALAYNHLVAKRKGEEKIDAKDFQFTAKETKELEPLADAVVKEMLIEMNAVQAFLLVLAIIYTGKFMLILEMKK